MLRSLAFVVFVAVSLVGSSATAQTNTNPNPNPSNGAPATAANTPSLRLSATPVYRADFLLDLHMKSTPTKDYRPSGNPLEVRDAGRLATAAGVACKVVDAGLVTTRDMVAYEVACENDLGWIVVKHEDASLAAYDCLALAASAKAITKGREIATCRLRGNVGRQKTGLQLLANRAKLLCTVTDGEFKGFGGEPQISRYEVQCRDGPGFLIDAPTPGSLAKVAYAPCDMAASLGSACTLKR